MRARAVILLVVLVVAALGAAAAVSMWWDAARTDAGSSEIRLVSLSPSVTATLGELDALDDLVARSPYCLWPEEALALPVVGSGLSPDYEGIVAARPSHILVEQAASAPVDDLRGLARTEVLPWLTLDDMTASVRRIGQIVDRDAAADDLANRLTARLGAGEASDDAATVLLVLAGEGLGQSELWFVKKNSLHGHGLDALGVRNAVPEKVMGAPTLSIERLVTLNPDVIVVLVHGEIDDEARARAVHAFDHLEPLSAPREGRVVVVSAPRLLTTGPGELLDYVDRLGASLEPLSVLP